MAGGADDDIFQSPLIKKQYVQEVLDFSSHYGSDSSLSYTAFNLIGKPLVYPNYGDFADTFLFRTYGSWWKKAPSFCKSFQSRNINSFCSQDFIDVLFEEKVYPICVDVFETYNPGAVVRISAFDGESSRWMILWEGSPSQECVKKAKIFSPPIKPTTFPTCIIRLEFCHYYLNYYTELDGVLLVGSTVPIYQESKLTLLYEKLHRISFPNAGNSTSNSVEKWKEKTSSECLNQQNWFDKLPSEVLNLIVSFLDLPSLCKAACLSKLFHRHCYDSLLYTELDLQATWEKISRDSLIGLEGRCSNLLKLNLSWCGHYDRISPKDFTNFLERCGSQLTHLRLANCKFVSNESLRCIAIVSTNLEELDIRCCQEKWLDQEGFLEIAQLQKLIRLNLYRTSIDLQSTIAIARSCVLLEHVNLGSCISINNFDEVAAELAQNCRNLKSLDLWQAKTLSAAGLTVIARNCFNLEELDVGWCSELSTTGGCLVELSRNCPHLRKLFLTAVRTVCDLDLMAIYLHCSKLEQIDILGTREVTPVAVLRTLDECKNLQYMDVSFCAHINEEFVAYLQHTFPHISIKRSFQLTFPPSHYFYVRIAPNNADLE